MSLPPEDKILERLKRWIFLMQQIHEAKHYLTKAKEKSHPHLWETMDGILEFLAYFRGALNSYAKCFVECGKGRLKIEQKEVFKGNLPLLENHLKLMEIRHNYSALCGANEFDGVDLKTTETAHELCISLFYRFSFPFDRLYELSALIDCLETHIVTNHSNQVSGLERSIGKTVRIAEGKVHE
jgi:hypothetical protein